MLILFSSKRVMSKIHFFCHLLFVNCSYKLGKYYSIRFLGIHVCVVLFYKRMLTDLYRHSLKSRYTDFI